MNYKDKIIAEINCIDVGEPVFQIVISDQTAYVKQEGWSPKSPNKGFYPKYVKHCSKRQLDIDNKKFIIPVEEVIDRIEGLVVNEIRIIFISCSPAKAPKRTKLFKNFMATIDKNIGKIDFMNSIFDIVEYYYNVTLTDSISHCNNDVHKKNIFQLLTLMERSYGETKKSSN